MKTLEQTEITEIIRLYKDGLNYKEIGSELNRDPRTIGKIVKNSGVEQIKIKRRY
jgi:DNA-binding NarL/FixJ family response regulator